MNKEQIQALYEQLFKSAILQAWGKLRGKDAALYDVQKQIYFGKVLEIQGIDRDAIAKRMSEMKKKYHLSGHRAA